MKKNIIEKIGTVAISATGILPIASCGKHDFTIVKDYLIEMPTYKTVDYENAQNYFKSNPIKAGGCSAVVQNIGTETNKHLIVGRNMDFAFSNKCAYIIRTAEPNKYKTLGLAYATAGISPDFDDVKKHGISEDWRKIAPFFCTDIINEKGLYCEIDMRNIERKPDGSSKFRCDGTNKGKGLPDVHMVALTRFIVNNCENVDQAINYVENNINVYNKEEDWNFSFILADATGKYGLLEFGYNKPYWKEGQNAQTNYFLNDELGEDSEQKFGIGRYNYIQTKIGCVKNALGMYNLMDNLSYSNVYKGRLCPFDMRSEAYEVLGMTYEEVIDPDREEEVYRKIDELLVQLQTMTEEEKRQLPWYWQSTFTNVVDIPSKSFHIRIFEDKDYIFDLKL